jgi:hypothetical protein
LEFIRYPSSLHRRRGNAWPGKVSGPSPSHRFEAGNYENENEVRAVAERGGGSGGRDGVAAGGGAPAPASGVNSAAGTKATVLAGTKMRNETGLIGAGPAGEQPRQSKAILKTSGEPAARG